MNAATDICAAYKVSNLSVSISSNRQIKGVIAINNPGDLMIWIKLRFCNTPIFILLPFE